MVSVLDIEKVTESNGTNPLDQGDKDVFATALYSGTHNSVDPDRDAECTQREYRAARYGSMVVARALLLAGSVIALILISGVSPSALASLLFFAVAVSWSSRLI